MVWRGPHDVPRSDLRMVGGPRHGLFLLEFSAQLLELADRAIVRVVTEQKSVRRLFRFGGLDDVACREHRIARLMS